MARTGNGIDIGAVYALLTEMSARLDRALVVLEDHTRQLLDLNDRMIELNRTVNHYHDAVTGQGIHYSEIEDRTRRIERHLKLEPGE